jgi:hypothetical protein
MLAIVDITNAVFEMGGAIVAAGNCKKIIDDKKVRGVFWPIWVFYTIWGFWNLYYYPAMNCWWSFWAGLLLTISNSIWVYYAWKYRKN